MKLHVLIVGLSIFTFFSSCQEKEVSKTEKEHNNIPRYKTQDWMQAYKFKDVNGAESASKKRICEKLYNEAWIANDVSAGMLIAQHGKILYENYRGMADKQRAFPITSETPLHIASTSKVMTALAILKLVEYNTIKLDDTIGTYIKGFPYKGVTIRDLLNHRSGLPNYMYFTDDPKVWDRKRVLKNRDVLQIMMEHTPPAAGAPGTHFSYNNTNFVLLALVVEISTKMPFPDAMDYMLFKPIGMKNTFVLRFPEDTLTVAKSYYNNGSPWKLDFLDGTYGDKNIYSTPRDMFLLDCAMYADDFLPDSLKEQIIVGYSNENEGIKNYGLGIRMMQWKDGKKFLYHNGWWHGTNTVYVRDYAHEAVIIAFGNKKTRSVYAPFSLVTLFGNYTLPVDSSIIKEQDSIRKLQYLQDSIDKSEKLDQKIKDSVVKIIPLNKKKQKDTSSKAKIINLTD